MTMTPLLEIRDLTREFGGLRAIGGVSMTVHQSELLGIIGPNGAGKTTLFNVLSGIYKPSSGSILFRGTRTDHLRPSEIARLGMARTFQNIRLFRELSVLENVRIALDAHRHDSPLSALLRLPGMKRGEERSTREALSLLEHFELGAIAHEKAGDLPYGSQRRVEIARALGLQPSLLLLDEPAAGMNPAEADKLLDFLRWVQKEFCLTILLIEHHMHLVMELCTRIEVLDFGARIAGGTPGEIRQDPRVIEAYLGAEGETP